MENLGKLVWNFTSELAKHAQDGFKHVDPHTYRQRMEHCLGCEHLNKDMMRCMQCGCHMPTKAGWRTSMCPLPEPKWRPDGQKTQE